MTNLTNDLAPRAVRLRRGLRRLVWLSAAAAMIGHAATLDARQLQPPAAPLALQASVVNSTVSLYWTLNQSGGTTLQFFLQAGTAPGLSNAAVLVMPSWQRSLTVDAPPGVYYVRILAINPVGISPPSNEIVVVVPGGCALPAVPTGLAATTNAAGVMLRWLAPRSGGVVRGYHLLAGSASGAADIGVFPLGAIFTLTAAAPPGRYFVRLVAYNECGHSAPGPEISFTIGSVTPIAVPAGIYDGVVFNHTNVFDRRPITSFTLQLNEPLPAAGRQISAVWTDNAGCRQSTNIWGGATTQGASVSIERLRCNSDGQDFVLSIQSLSGGIYEGRCPLGGSNCTFRMMRRP